MPFHYLPDATPQESTVRERARELADKVLRPTAAADDIESKFRKENFHALAKAGLTALTVTRDPQGNLLPSRIYLATIEEISKASAAMAVALGVTQLPLGALQNYGSEAQKKKFLPLLQSGEWLGAFSLSEPNAGSDAANLQLKAEKTKTGYRLNGIKSWCSSAGHADIYLLMARTSPDRSRGVSAFLIPATTPGFHVGKPEKKLGLRGSSLAQLIFEDCEIPTELRLADEGDGLKIALSQLDSGRLTIGTVGLGLAIETLDCFWETRSELAKGGWEFDTGTKEYFGEYYARLQALRSLIYAAADLKDQKKHIRTAASQAKLLGSDLAMQLASDALAYTNLSSVSLDQPLQRYFRDAKALQIVEGTNQIQRMLLARDLDRQWEQHCE